ncbi:40S ribosomal protein S11 [Lates japonicus]|uniref:Small ribosomal subunit protein uS17 n=1 Tax=Lates japonicus TaxID=270547 RepID=A0AAD3MWG0_LATJO|nr:40S ribosomal protein S11 [Lates japonicus]
MAGVARRRRGPCALSRLLRVAGHGSAFICQHQSITESYLRHARDIMSEQRKIQRPENRQVTEMKAIEGTYIDKKCPFTGNVSIRGRILSGVVTKMKMQRTIVIRRDYLHYIRKYNRFEKRHKNLSVHLSPCFRDVTVGDIVTVGECRPLSKTVRFNVLKVTKAAGAKKQFQKF